MNRLTEKNSIVPRNMMNAEYAKLADLEDIEEELGIDLITLFRALKQETIYCINGGKIMKLQVVGFNYNTGYLLMYDEEEQTTCENYNLYDYGKTWALTREELENDR